MEIAHHYLAKFENKSGGPRNEREEMLDRFLARLNQNCGKYRPMTYARLAHALQGIPTADLHAFYRKCETYRSFGAGFHYELKPRV